MEAKADLWNLLHDGSIVSFSGNCPGTVSVKVEIEYLCTLLAIESQFLLIHLQNCRDIAYIPFISPDTVLRLESLSACDLEILRATGENNLVSVTCTEGVIRLNYEGVSCELDNGVPIPFSTLSQACKKYWTTWKQ